LSLFNRPEVNIRKYDNSISIISSNGKSWNQKHFALTFPKPPQPGRKNRSRPLKLQNTVPRQDKIKSKEDQKKAHIWIRHSLRKIFQRPSIYLAVRRQAPFRCSYISKAHLEKAEAKESQDGKKRRDLKKDSKKKTGPHTTTLESKKIIKDKKPKESNKAAKIPSKSSHENEPYKQSNSKLDTNSESKDSKEVSKKDQTKDKKDSKNCKGTDTTCTKTEPKKDSKNSSKKDPDAESETYSKNHSKKDTKKDSKKASDGESVDSKDAKKDSKKEKTNAKKDSKKKDAKKDAKKDTDSTDVESVGSKDSKKGKKNAKKDNVGSTDAESEFEWESKKDKKDAKKDTKKGAKMNTESTDASSDDYSKKGLSKPLQSAFKDSDAESDQSLYKLGAKNRGVESDATSIDSKKEGQGLK
uniref:Cylicin N-terminal domain-containing protein n=1 Tax=Loxodonta africana TaxID=9785 RepID=G3U276_LOXAF